MEEAATEREGVRLCGGGGVKADTGDIAVWYTVVLIPTLSSLMKLGGGRDGNVIEA